MRFNQTTHYILAVSFLTVYALIAGEPPAPDQPKPPDAAEPAADKANENNLPDLDAIPSAALPEGVFMQSGDLTVAYADVKKVEAQYLIAQKKKNPKFDLPPEILGGVRKEIAAQLLQNSVLEKYAKDNKLATPPETLEKEIGKVKDVLKERGSSYEQMLVDSGQTDEEFRKFWSAKFAVEEQLGKTVKDEEIKKVYEEYKEKAPLRRASHILYMYKGSRDAEKVQPPVTRTKDEAKAAAEEALKKLKAGGDFAALAKESSDCPSKKDGGDLNFFPLKGEGAMDEAFGEAVYKMEKPGDRSGVVETPFGFHIIKLTEVKDDDFKQDIRRHLVSEKFDKQMQQMMAEQFAKAKFNEKLAPAAPLKQEDIPLLTPP